MFFKQVAAGLNIQPLLAQIDAYPEIWNTDDSWTRGKPLLNATTTIVLRYNKSSRPNLNDWDRPAFKMLDAAVQVIFDLMRAIPGEHLGKVMISKMRPGEKLDWHIDTLPNGVMQYWQRYQIPLQVNPGVRFCVEDEELYMAPGTAWWFDNQKMHAVFNDSETDRISMFADIRPFKLL